MPIKIKEATKTDEATSIARKGATEHQIEALEDKNDTDMMMYHAVRCDAEAAETEHQDNVIEESD